MLYAFFTTKLQMCNIQKIPSPLTFSGLGGAGVGLLSLDNIINEKNEHRIDDFQNQLIFSDK